MKHRLWVCKSRAKAQGLEFALDIDWLMAQPFMCAVTGSKFVTPARGHGPLAPSLDRIDSKKGYTKDNVRLVVLWYNIAKREWDDLEIQDFIISAAKTIKKRRSVIL